MAVIRPKKKWHTRRTLHNRLRQGIHASDLALEYPIQWLEDTNEDGTLADGPGLGTRVIWQNHDCSFASALSLSAVDPYYAHEDHMSGLQRSIAEVMLQIEYGEQLQFLWFPWEDAHEFLERFRRTQPDDPPFKKWWHEARAAREYERLESGDLRCFRSIISLNVSPDDDSRIINPYQINPGLGELWGAMGKVVELSSILKQNLDGLNRAQYEAMARRVTRRMQTIQSILGAAGQFQANPWRAQDMFSYLRRAWATDQWQQDRVGRGGPHRLPRADARWAPFANYFLPSGGTLEDTGDAFRVGPYWHRVLVMKTLPAMSDVGHVPAALTIPETVRGIKNMIVAMTARPVDKQTEMQKLRIRIRHLSGQMKGNVEHADNLAIIQDYENRLTELRKATRPAMFYAHLHVHLWEKDRELLREREHQVNGALTSYLEMALEPEDYETLPFVLGFEQPGYPRYPDANRMFSVVPVEVAALAPVSAYSDGCIRADATQPIPLVVETDTGVPYGLDLWPGEDRVSNFGGIGIGLSGSGKTNFYQQLILAYANRNTDVVVIDGAEQPGFPSLTSILGGKYIEFNDDFRINPLATEIIDGQQQNPSSDELTDILVTLGAMFRPGRKLEPLEAGVLTSAVRYVFENRSGDYTRVRLADLPRGLSPDRFREDDRQRSLASEFSRVLEETWLGRYGHIMSGTEELPHGWLTVFDVRSLTETGKEQLQAVVVSLLFRFLERLSRNNVRRVGKDKRQILGIFDEAWKAAKNPQMLTQIITAYRTGRARNMSMHLLSQRMEDILDLLQFDENGQVVGKAESSPILAGCSHTFFFALTEKDAKLAGSAFSLNDAQVDALAKLGGKAGQYREFVHWLKVSNGQPAVFTKLRSRIFPEELWATTTSPNATGERAEFEAMLTRELTAPGARLALVQELQHAGWPVDSTTADAMLRQCGVIHRLAARDRAKSAR